MGFSASPGLCHSKCGVKLEVTALLGLSLEGTWEADFPPLCLWSLSITHSKATFQQQEESHPHEARRNLSGDDGGSPTVAAGVWWCGGSSVHASLEMQSPGGHGILMEPPGREASMDHYQEKGCTTPMCTLNAHPPEGILNSYHISRALGI